MVVGDKIDEAVREFKRLWLEASQQKLQQVCALWDPWIRRMLTEPLPDDWHAEVDDFVDEVRETIGLVIAPHSVADIEALIRSRAGGTGVFAAIGPAPRQPPDPDVLAKLGLPRGYKPAPPEDILAGFTAQARWYAMPTARRARIITVASPKPGKGKPASPISGTPAKDFPLYKDPKTGNTFETIIDATGTRYGDKRAADLATGIKSKKLPGSPIWHHADFDPTTGKMKMQLVQQLEHATEGHAGGFVKFLDWAAETLNSGNLKKLSATQAQALANALHSEETMRQLAGKLADFGIKTAPKGGALVIKKGNSIIGRTLTREVAGKTIKLVAKAGAVLFVISAAADAKAAGGDDWQAMQAAMREMVSAELWEAGFQYTVVAGSETVAGGVLPPPATSKAVRQRLQQLSPEQRLAEVRNLQKTYTFMGLEQWTSMKFSMAKQLDEGKDTWDRLGTGKAK
jgi:hypothetical protein